jgi:hypothetical protein
VPSIVRGRVVYPKVAIPDPQGKNPKPGRPFVVISQAEEIKNGERIRAVGITGELKQAPDDHYVDLPWGPTAKTGLTQKSAADGQQHAVWAMIFYPVSSAHRRHIRRFGMTRIFLASISVVSVLAVVPYAVDAQKETPKKGALPKSNQVYVKIIWPTDSATRDKDRPVVESWIEEQLKKRGLTKFAAATAWVPLADKGEESKRVWNGNLDDLPSKCPVSGQIVERVDGRIKVRLDGWIPIPYGVTVSLTDEPGSRGIAAVEELKDDSGLPYVAVLIGPPPEKAAAP